jgi:uncharacterized membrane protein
MAPAWTNWFVLAMAVAYFLLAAQAEPVTGFFGWLFGSVLVLALIGQTIKQSKVRSGDVGESSAEDR